ncbi:hypothetical protein AX14_000477 [Amanita brunnescens Koide BX004]|nr:hypothetical protein AX14_000477 [Amanita brunnescens Koide BX004]
MHISNTNVNACVKKSPRRRGEFSYTSDSSERIVCDNDGKRKRMLALNVMRRQGNTNTSLMDVVESAAAAVGSLADSGQISATNDDNGAVPFLFVNVCSDICNFLHKVTRMVRSPVGKP